MADPYWRYRAPIDTATAIPEYIPSDAATLSARPLWPPSHNHLSSTSDFRQNDILAYRDRPYGVDDIVGTGVRSESGYKSYVSELENQYLRRRDVLLGPGIPSIVNERPESLRKDDGGSLGRRESNVLFVDGLPSDCTRREVSHLFRPFPGFKEITVMHREPRNIEDKATVLCFVEYTASNYALTALEALQGYKFDHQKPDLAVLRIHFAQSPFQLPSDRDPLKLPSDRDPFQAPDRDPVKLPSDRYPFQRVPLNLPSDRDPFQRAPLNLPSDRDPFLRVPLNLPSDRDPFRLPSHREEQTPLIPRVRELAFQDKEAMLKRKYEGSPRRRYEGSPKKPGASTSKPSEVLAIKAGGVKKLKGKGKVKKAKASQAVASTSEAKGKSKANAKVPLSERKCYHCDKMGHWKRNCPEYLAELAKKNQLGVAAGSGAKET